MFDVWAVTKTVVVASLYDASVGTAASAVASSDIVPTVSTLVTPTEADELSVAGDGSTVVLCAPAVAVCSDMLLRSGAVAVVRVTIATERVVMIAESIGAIDVTVLMADADCILCAFSSASLEPVAVMHSSEKVAA